VTNTTDGLSSPNEMPSGPDPLVLFVIGHPRCGSTVIGNVLAELPGIFHAGEMCYLWKDGLPAPRRRCGCGLEMRECEVWRRSLARATGAPMDETEVMPAEGAAPTTGLPGAEPVRMSRLQSEALGRFVSLRAARLDPRWRPQGAAAEYLSEMARIYRALAAETGASVIIDSSKWPHDGRLIAGLAHIEQPLEVAFVHLLREPWGGVFSRLPRDRPDIPGSRRPATRRRVLLESLRWLKSNIMAEIVIHRSGSRAHTLRYEDFTADPAAALAGMADFMGVVGASSVFDGRTLMLSVNHTTGGNRNRWQTGEIEISQDRRWKSGMSTGDVRLVSLVTLLYRRRYGNAP